LTRKVCCCCSRYSVFLVKIIQHTGLTRTAASKPTILGF
jgi:hypothetical protein